MAELTGFARSQWRIYANGTRQDRDGDDNRGFQEILDALPRGVLERHPERLQSAKDLLLRHGTPARTAMYYFVELGSMVRPEDLRLVEDVQFELQDMA